ncbi:hypothetical protein BC567DRAFT_211794 [Phyllosticta citribraziliensis]
MSSANMEPVYKDQETGLTYSKSPKYRILVGMDSEGPSVIWSSMLPMFFASRDGNEQIEVSALSKASVRLVPPFNGIKLETEEDRKKALALFRRIWIRIFPDVKNYHFDQYSNCAVRISEKERVSVEEFINRVRQGRQKLAPHHECLSFDTEEDAQDSMLVMFVEFSSVVVERNKTLLYSTPSTTQNLSSSKASGKI